MPFVIARVSYPPQSIIGISYSVCGLGLLRIFIILGGVVSLAFTVRLGCYLLFSELLRSSLCLACISQGSSRKQNPFRHSSKGTLMKDLFTDAWVGSGTVKGC